MGYTRKFDDGVNDGIRDGVKKVSFVDESDGVNFELNALYEVIRKMPGLNARTLAKQIDKSIPTTERYIKKLRVNNYIQFVGAPKTGGYFPKE